MDLEANLYLNDILESFWTNPQYRITLTEPDDGDKDGICQVIVGLMQKDRRKARAQGQDNYAIGYMMYKVKFTRVFFKNLLSCGAPNYVLDLNSGVNQ